MPEKNESSLNPPEVGKEVDEKFLKSFYPAPKQGMKWVFTMNINVQGITMQAELIMEVTEINGENVKIKTSMGNQNFENITNLSSFSPLPAAQPGKTTSSGFRYVTSEDLVVPFKNFSNIPKLLAGSRDSNAFLWLAPGIGPVKFGISAGGIPASLELKEFNGL